MIEPAAVSAVRRRLRALIQFARFGAVGGAATLAHVSLYTALAGVMRLAPVLANLLAFAAATTLSYLGHYAWTFRAAAPPSRTPRPSQFGRFAVTALLGLCLNTLFVLLMVDVAGAGYLSAVPLMIGVTPVILFLINKRWVFRCPCEPRPFRPGTRR